MSDLTNISKIGEFGLIERLKNNIHHYQTSTLKGIGDDAAVIHATPNEKIILSTDILLEGVHFDLRYFPLKHLGYKIVVVGISDILAMNAIPRQMTLAMGISSKFSLEAVEELHAGVQLACEKYQIDWVGGDTSSSCAGLTLAISVVGTAPEVDIVYRNMANQHDLIVVTGDLGAAYMGLQILEREKKIYLENPQIQPYLEGNEYVLERQLKPDARLDIIQLFKKLELIPSAMIDISDGLASDLLQITKSSDVGCRIYEEKLPISQEAFSVAEDFHIHPSTCILNGGEDYELLFTIPQKDYDKIKGNPNFTVIGHIIEVSNGNNLVTQDNQLIALQAQGWK
jgi:thiamine-monophosphate kinase